MSDKTSDKTSNDNIEDKSDYRYLGYAGRIARLSRYLAFTSDVGEAFRPVIPVNLVRATYGISWLYVGYDVSKHGLAEMTRSGATDESISRVVLFQSLFQGIASMGLPALTIHTQVNVSKKLFSTYKGGKYLRWGPTMTGLAWIPLLPFMFDHPTHIVLNKVFDTVWPIENNNQSKH